MVKPNKPAPPAQPGCKQIGSLFQTIRKMRLQRRGGLIPPETIQRIGILFEAIKKRKRKNNISLDDQ